MSHENRFITQFRAPAPLSAETTDLGTLRQEDDQSKDDLGLCSQFKGILGYKKEVVSKKTKKNA